MEVDVKTTLTMALFLCGCAGAERPRREETKMKMQADVMGSGRPLVLVGGGLTGILSWEPHARRLSENRRVVRLQPLNVQLGLEDRPLPAGYSVKMESAALDAALDGVGLTEPVDVAAWSYGAEITLDWALDHPGRVRTLTLVEPPALWLLRAKGGMDADVERTVAALAQFQGDIDEDDLERFLCLVGLCPPGQSVRSLPQWPVWVRHRRSIRNSPAAIEHRDDPARLRAFDRPVFLVKGLGSAEFLRRIIDGLASELPHAEVADWPAGHGPHIVSMDAFLARLAVFQGDAPPPIALGSSDLAWMPAPTPPYPEGVRRAVLEGDPTRPGLFTMRVELPAGTVLPLHTHPQTDRLTVLSGSVMLGIADHVDPARERRFEAGDYWTTPAGARHWLRTDEGCVLQMTTTGPWRLDLVD
jgi:pimeloyl-ACP methyl ester carboxylesterase/mannose-6-phosphate isomerase-like protein (cupin superfamily)